MKLLILVILGALSVVGLSGAEVGDEPILQIRKIAAAATDDSEEMTVFGSATGEVLHVEKTIAFDQKALKSATVQQESDQVCIAITFSAEGQKRFSEFTRDNIGLRLAIVIDGRLYCAPVIRDQIPGGKAEISGQFTEQEARDLAAKINEAIKRQ